MRLERYRNEFFWKFLSEFSVAAEHGDDWVGKDIQCMCSDLAGEVLERSLDLIFWEAVSPKVFK